MEDLIKQFLSVQKYYGNGNGNGNGSGYGSGDGSGDGSGNGSGSGYGFGDGFGDGFGSGDGSGDGSGYGSSSGDGYGYGSSDSIKSYNGKTVYLIDDVQTIIYSVHENIAKGAILNSDLTLTDCYIAKYEDNFAHGDNAHKAMQDAINKAIQKMSIEQRIDIVVSKYKDIDAPIEHSELFALHSMLTGSCLMGRRQFAQEHNLDPEHGTMSMREFIKLTKDAYGGDIIRQLAKEIMNKAMEEQQ